MIERTNLETQTPRPRVRDARTAALIGISIALTVWATAPLALMAGILFAFLVGHPQEPWIRPTTKWLLQASVVLLGFSMDLCTVLRLGLQGSLFAAISIACTLLLGWWLGRKLALAPKTSLLVSAGTAICGGSAIAAVSTVIAANELEIAVSIGTVFVLNAAALWVFPAVGHWLHLSQSDFGLWAGVAIHDISSVVGAGLSYGQEALQNATAVKLSRTLWIVPLTLGIALVRKKQGVLTTEGLEAPKITVPWFIGFFLLASGIRSLSPFVAQQVPLFSGIAHRGMILVLFLVGTALSPKALKAVGWRSVATGLVLWSIISVGSLAAILLLSMSA